MTAIILARVSTEEQKEAGNSLPAQVERLKSYCQHKGLEIAKTFSFDESAYKTKRDEFDKILEYLGSAKETVAVCFDKVDRFSRNVFDKRVAILYDLAMQGKIELHFASDNLVVTSEISAVEKFHFGINLGLAKYYSDAISDNTKRAIEQKLRKGEWPGKAPIGYHNVSREDGHKNIELDPERAFLVRKVFETYAAAKCSMRTIATQMRKLGLTNNTASKSPVSTSQIEWILKNPFYYGEMLYNGKIYQHRYEPLISRYLWQKCQEVAKNWHKKPFKYAALPFVFRGLIKCNECGCTVTPEIKKGKHIYYSCTNYRRKHQRIYVNEKELLKPIYEALKGIQIPQDDLGWLTADLKKIHQSESQFHKQSMEQLREGYDKIEARIGTMYEDKLDGRITQDMYDRKLKEYKEKQADLHLQMEQHSNADEDFYVNAVRVLNLASRALEIFESSETDEKRVLLNFLLQNPVLEGKTLQFELKKPFDSILECTQTGNWLRG